MDASSQAWVPGMCRWIYASSKGAKGGIQRLLWYTILHWQSVSEPKTVEVRRVLHTHLSVQIVCLMSKIYQLTLIMLLECYWACHGGRWIVRCWRVPSVVLTQLWSKPTRPFGWMSSWWNAVRANKTTVWLFHLLNSANGRLHMPSLYRVSLLDVSSSPPNRQLSHAAVCNGKWPSTKMHPSV